MTTLVNLADGQQLELIDCLIDSSSEDDVEHLDEDILNPVLTDSDSSSSSSSNQPSELSSDNNNTNGVSASSQQQTEYTYTEPARELVCTGCESTSFAEDHRSGDWICTQCGLVSEERLISNEAEYRVFAEDSASYNKIRVGQAYNPLMEYSLTERSRLERDEKEFLWDGLRNIDEIFFKLYRGDSVNSPALNRAKELFQKAFHMQVEQKKGAVPMKRSGDAKRLKNRQKFSRRKQFVVSCIYQALKENNIITWNTQDLSDQLDGIQVSKYSVRNCLKDLKVF